jgi:replicative DNA helicase
MESPPNNAEAEMAVLGSVLIDPSCLDTINTVVTPAAFYKEKHGWIFEVMLELKGKGEPIDLLSVSDALESKGKLEPVGGEIYISSLVSAVPTSLHAEHYATLVRKTYNKRRLADASRAIMKAAFDDKIDDENAYLAALESLNKAEPTGLPAQAVGGPDMMDNMFAVLLQAQREKDARKTDPEMIWPWACMRQYLKRWRIGQPAILIAEGGAGKTAFCMEVAGYNAQNGGNIIYVHTEDEVLTLLGRRLSTISGVAYSTIEQASYADSDGLIDVDMHGIKVWVPPTLVGSISSVRSWRGNLWFVSASGKTVPEIIYILNRVVQQTGHPDAVIFDWFLDHSSARLKRGSASEILFWT